MLHISTAEQPDILHDATDVSSVECLPQHLTLAAPECCDPLKGIAQMHPPIREVRHRDALWRAVNTGIVDVMSSDHAPHIKEENARPYPSSPSGMPGVQTIVPIMLTHVNDGKLTEAETAFREAIRLLDAVQYNEENGEVCPAGWTKGKKAMKASNEGVKAFFQNK